MEQQICMGCDRNNVAVWIYIWLDNSVMPMCQECYEEMMTVYQLDPSKVLGRFQLLEEYLAEQELKNGSQGIRLTH